MSFNDHNKKDFFSWPEQTFEMELSMQVPYDEA